MIELKNIEKKYKNGKSSFLALENINLLIEDKGLVIILGKSGSGKSTLLNILGGLDNQTNGELIIDNKSTTNFKDNDYDDYRNNYVSFVFQEFHLINEITVNENVEIPLKLRNENNRSSKIDAALSLVNLNNIGHKKCNELSGGQRQRVAIARALVKDPKILLADEPTGALDSFTSKEIFEILKKISKKKIVIVVTHNEELAYSYADRIIKLKDGKIEQDITKSSSVNIKQIASNIIEVDCDYQLTKKDLQKITNEGSYLGVSTNLHDLTLAYDEILDYKKENKDEFKKTEKIEKNNNKFDNSKSHLSFKDANKMAKENLKNNRKKYNFLVGIFTVFNTILILSLIFSFLSIHSFVSKQTNSKNSLNIIEVSHLVTKTKTSEILTLSNILDNDNYAYVNDYKLTPYYGTDVADLEFVSLNFSGIIELNDVSNLNLELIVGNKLFSNMYEIIISDYMAYNFSKYGVLAMTNNNLEIFYPSNNKDLINKEIRIKETSKNYKIIGIYKTNFTNLLSKHNKGDKEIYSNINSNIDFLYSKLIANIGFYKQYKEDYKGYTFFEDDEVFIVKLNADNQTKKFYFSDTRVLLNKEKIGNIGLYNLDGQLIEVPSELNENEIIISLDQVLSLFNDENKSINELLKTTEIYNYLNSEELTLELLQNNKYSSTDKEDIQIIKGIKVKVVGILNEGNRMFVANNIYDSLKNHLQGYDSIYFYNEDTSYALSTNIEKLANLENSFVVGNNLINVDDIEFLNGIISTLSASCIAFTIIFLVLSFIIHLNHMNIIVKSRYREISLYRTIGAKKKDIYKMFVFESLNIAIKTTVIGTILSYIIVSLINNSLSAIALLDIGNTKIISFNLIYCLLAFITVFLICTISTYLSIKGLLKKKLVEAFKGN